MHKLIMKNNVTSLWSTLEEKNWQVHKYTFISIQVMYKYTWSSLSENGSANRLCNTRTLYKYLIVWLCVGFAEELWTLINVLKIGGKKKERR